jgi:hypothetical protein
MSDKSRPFVIQVLVNAAERDELQKAAEQTALSVSSYVRARALGMLRREAKMAQQFERSLEMVEH